MRFYHQFKKVHHPTKHCNFRCLGLSDLFSTSSAFLEVVLLQWRARVCFTWSKIVICIGAMFANSHRLHAWHHGRDLVLYGEDGVWMLRSETFGILRSETRRHCRYSIADIWRAGNRKLEMKLGWHVSFKASSSCIRASLRQTRSPAGDLCSLTQNEKKVPTFEL